MVLKNADRPERPSRRSPLIVVEPIRNQQADASTLISSRKFFKTLSKLPSAMLSLWPTRSESFRRRRR
jgi:hypothetical protein